MIVLSDPFKNPGQLEVLKRSFAEQPNWKASVLEDQSWEGTGAENIQKYRGLVAISEK